MIVASFLVKDLHLPWQWGAEWFLDQLVDGDMANNPVTQGEKFDRSGDYIRRWVPELRSADDAHLSKGERPDAYPAPIVDHGAERPVALRRYQSI
jgi:deoxyribodipyrimidine photo-lyase